MSCWVTSAMNELKGSVCNFFFWCIYLEFQKKRIHDLENGFQGDLDDLKQEFDKERSDVKCRFSIAYSDCKPHPLQIRYDRLSESRKARSQRHYVCNGVEVY